MKRWRLETEEGKYFVYAPSEGDAIGLLETAKLGTFTGGIREVGSFENGFLSMPDEERMMIQASVQYGEVKMPKGKKR
jgi:hypothetical protein